MIWIGAVDSKDKQYRVSNKILKNLLPSTTNEESANQLFLSDYVFNELINNITNKQKNRRVTNNEREKIMKRILEMIYKSRYVTILKITGSHIGTALNYMQSHPTTFSSLTDWLSLILMNENEIPVIKTLDPDFKRVTQLIPEFKQIQVCEV